MVQLISVQQPCTFNSSGELTCIFDTILADMSQLSFCENITGMRRVTYRIIDHIRVTGES